MVEDTKTKVIEGITEMVDTQEVIIKVQVVIKEVVEVINKPIVTNLEEVAIVVSGTPRVEPLADTMGSAAMGATQGAVAARGGGRVKIGPGGGGAPNCCLARG